jgi:hypothetical protein
MADDIGVTQVPVSASPKTPAARKKVLARLDVMQRELAYVQSAMNRLRVALNAPQPSSRPIGDALMDSRNWTLSVAMSHAYIHSMLSTLEFEYVAMGDLPRLQFNDDNLPELFVRAVEMETQKAHADPDSDAHLHRGPVKGGAVPKTFGPSGTRCYTPGSYGP